MFLYSKTSSNRSAIIDKFQPVNLKGITTILLFIPMASYELLSHPNWSELYFTPPGTLVSWLLVPFTTALPLLSTSSDCTKDFQQNKIKWFIETLTGFKRCIAVNTFRSFKLSFIVIIINSWQVFSLPFEHCALMLIFRI